MKIPHQRRAVAPVIATLLMIAVAVAMSVIIFMWSQGFLSQTSSSTGGQQGAQNQAAQSSISVELATFVSASTTAGGSTCTGAGTDGVPKITLIVRNVGAVAVTLGSLTITGSSSNAGFTGAVTISSVNSATTVAVTSNTETGGLLNAGWKFSSTAGSSAIAKGSSSTVVVCNTAAATAMTSTAIKSGDVINLKLTTNVGTFAQSQFTVP